jgi:hypothetical protein
MITPNYKKDADYVQRKLVWFSCGAASAVAAKLTLEAEKLNEDIQIVYCNTSTDEHKDNARFMKECSEWLGRPIITISSSKYLSVSKVFESKKYMSGPAGAPCTVELKKKPRFAYQHPDDIHVFGYTTDEKKRIKDFENNNPELFLEWPLVDAGLSKKDCFTILKEAGIQLPEMYRLGFKNNNCIGCVKAQSPKYWNMVREHFPTVFAERAAQSRRIGCRIIKIGKVRSFLDELDPQVKTGADEDLSCGPQCRFTPEEDQDFC